MKSEDRNKPCQCGSGMKTKKCCGRPLTGEEYHARLKAEEEDRIKRAKEIESRIHVSGRNSGRRHAQSILMVATALTMGMSVAPIDTNNKRKW